MIVRNSRTVLVVLVATATYAAPHISPGRIPSAGESRAVLTIDTPGRYAVRAISNTGVALTLVDRMAGPAEVTGIPGEKDGRIDAFLDRGEYLIRADGRGSGEATLTVAAFSEPSRESPQLLPFIVHQHQLRDLEQLSFPIQIRTRQNFVVEVAGRSLADLRLWGDGDWLIDAKPTIEIVQPQVGQELRVCRIHTFLEPGDYRLTAYGGPPLPWTVAGDASPLYLRVGIPRLPEASRRRTTMSPFGVDRFLVPGTANYYRLALDEAMAATIELDLSGADPFARGTSVGEITKSTSPPIAELEVAEPSASERQVAVYATAGTPYSLQHFQALHHYPLRGPGRYWLSSIHAGDPRDSIDATAVLTRPLLTGRGLSDELVDARVIAIGEKSSWHRRFNLVEPGSLLVRVGETGTYTVSFAGNAQALVQVEPFLVTKPPNYEAPPPRPGPLTLELDAGLYVVTFTPLSQGIIDATMARADSLGDTVMAPLILEARFGEVRVAADQAYLVTLGEQAGVKRGLVVREIPVAIATPLPLALAADEVVAVPVHCEIGAVVTATADDGSALPVRLAGGEWNDRVVASEDDFRVEIQAREKAAMATLEATLTAPRPALAAAARHPLTPLAVEAPFYFDLARDETRTFLLTADRDGLYTIATTGRLATSGRLRTRLEPRLAEVEQNGVGRNFSLGRYLRAGEYLVSVRALGQTQGRAGVALQRVDTRDGGALVAGTPARLTLAENQGARFLFSVPREQSLRIAAITRGETLSGRLEDVDGWPLLVPDSAIDFERTLPAGVYRVIVNPRRRETQVVTRLDQLAGAVTRDGHGPHPITLGETVNHVWRESPEREPDHYPLIVPAPIHAHLRVSDPMRARIIRRDPGGQLQTLAETDRDGAWDGELDAGEVILELRAIRADDRRPYRVSLSADEVTSGDQREVTAPAKVVIAVGQPGHYAIESFGRDDVRARLLDDAGEVVATSDDRVNDWGFLLSTRLAAARYQLMIEAVGVASAATTIKMRPLPERTGEVIRLPFQGITLPAAGGVLHDLIVAPASSAIAITAEAAETVTLRVLDREGRVVATATGEIARLLLPVAGEPQLRLHVTTPDGRGYPVKLELRALEPLRLTEAAMRSGRLLPASTTSLPTFALITLDSPGVVTLSATPPGSLVSTRPVTAAEPVSGNLIASHSSLWLFVPERCRPRLHRVNLVDGESTRLSLPDHAGTSFIDLKPDPRPLVVRVAAEAGQPGIMPARRAHRTLTSESAPRQGVGDGSAVTVSLDPTLSVIAVRRTDGDSGLDVRVRADRLASPTTATPIDYGTHDFTVVAGGTLALKLPAGRNRLVATVGRELIATLGDSASAAIVLWHGGDAFLETLVSEHQRLLLLNPGKAVTSMRLELVADGGESNRLVVDRATPFREWMSRPGRLLLDVTATGDPAARLHVRGGSGYLLTQDGDIRRGDDLLLGPARGHLDIEHGSGPLVAWITNGSDTSPSARSTNLLTLPTTITAPVDGARYAIAVSTPTLLQLRGRDAVATTVTNRGCPSRHEFQLDATAVDIYATHDVTLDLESQFGEATIAISSAPVATIGEGLGPELLLAAGDAHGLRFTTSRAGPIGLALRADHPDVTATLVDACGVTIATGHTLMPTLPPGEYALIIRAGATAPPLRARLAIAGLELPGDGPPGDVIKSYLTQIPEAPEPTQETYE